MYKKGEKVFNLSTYYNIRKSFYIKKFINCIFYIHNGKYFVVNDPVYLKLVVRRSKCKFKLGQFSYNKFIHIKGGITKDMSLLNEDIKKKRGVSIKIKKKKKFIFVPINS